jgi:hypothetical protein
MRGSICGLLVLVAAAGMALPLHCQTGGAQAASSGTAPHKPPPQHYTAETKETWVRKLPDGTVITQEINRVRAVDSEGRSMESTTKSTELLDGKPVTNFDVRDEAADITISWTSYGTKATVRKILGNVSRGYTLSESMASSPACARQIFLQAHDGSLTYVDLGTTIIQGVEAHGFRVTRTTPVGAEGNDQPMVHTEETWATTGDNPGRLVVRRVSDDPKYGRSTLELVSLSLEEPDLSVFQPPAGYEIETEDCTQFPCRISKPPAQ